VVVELGGLVVDVEVLDGDVVVVVVGGLGPFPHRHRAEYAWSSARVGHRQAAASPHPLEPSAPVAATPSTE
jgi:hypothetical protein